MRQSSSETLNAYMDLNFAQTRTPQAEAIRAHWVPEVYKIAVLRANAIGDFIFALPALQSLRLAYPQAEIVWYGLPWHAEFLNGRPTPVNRAVVIPPMRGLNGDRPELEDLAEIEQFFDRQREECFDLALQMHGGGRESNPFVRRLGARVSAGLRTPDAEALDRNAPYVFYQLEYLRWLEVAALVGAPPLAFEPYLEVTPADLEESFRAVPADDRPLVALHPGAGDPRRRWAAQKYAQLGDILARRGARVVVTGAYGDEGELTRAVVQAMEYPAEDLFGRIDLGGLMGLFSRCRVVISNDSGPLHVARAVGTPTVGIYWCGNMITCGPLGTTRHRTAISWQLECPVCGANTIHNRCSHPVSFVDDVTVEEVAAAALELYSERITERE